MATIKDVKTELRHREWAEQIQDCQNSGQTVKEWCKGIGISTSTYYNRLRAVREKMLSRQPKLHEIVPVSVSPELTENIAVLPEKAVTADKPKSLEKIIIRKNGLEVELPKKVITFKLDEDKCNCPQCRGKLRELAPKHITSRLAVIPGKAYMV